MNKKYCRGSQGQEEGWRGGNFVEWMKKIFWRGGGKEGENAVLALFYRGERAFGDGKKNFHYPPCGGRGIYGIICAQGKRRKFQKGKTKNKE